MSKHYYTFSLTFILYMLLLSIGRYEMIIHSSQESDDVYFRKVSDDVYFRSVRECYDLMYDDPSSQVIVQTVVEISNNNKFDSMILYHVESNLIPSVNEVFIHDGFSYSYFYDSRRKYKYIPICVTDSGIPLWIKSVI